MTYAEKLKDPRWQRRRLEVLSAANFTCQDCGSKDKTLHVHHKRYEKGKDPWEAKDRDLVSLCEECHSYRHTLEQEIKAGMSGMPIAFLESLATASLIMGSVGSSSGAERCKLLAAGLNNFFTDKNGPWLG